MKQEQTEISIRTAGVGFTEINSAVASFVRDAQIQNGLLTVFCCHTSASLIIQENADPDVLRDLADWFAAIAPRDPSRYRHGAEGPDDMPAHIRTAITQVQLSIPIADGRMVLGTWQGIYLFEHRDQPHLRRIALHALGA